jgi:carboxypeptidase family protein
MGKINNKWLLTLLIFPLAVSVRANDVGKEEGVLHGYVTDAVTKKPLPGVVVSATVRGSKSQKEVTTDADGYFSFSRLPAASVTIQFDKKGYQSFKRPNVTVREKTTVGLNVEFLPEETDVENDNSEYPLLRFLQAS